MIETLNNKTTFTERLLNKFGLLNICLILAVFFIYYFSNPKPSNYYNYTFLVGENFLSGKIGLTATPPPWLNEMIPFEGLYYSAFPLGSVITMLPFSALKAIGLITEMPAAFISGLLASAFFVFCLLIAKTYQQSCKRETLFSLTIVLGTWTWTNLTFGGAWQLALGFAMLGQLGAIYFSSFRKNALLAGLFFALAFGNRTEILLIAPVLIYLLCRDETTANTVTAIAKNRQAVAQFCAAPFLLGVSTLVYNHLRFHAFTDFGYARIPGVLEEEWYRYGIFAFSYIPLNVQEMLVTPWKALPEFPYYVPTGFGGAIWWSSPFLFYLFRFGARDRALKYSAWAAIAILTLLLWTHGNPGGWQFSYRYSMVLLPWILVVLLENAREKISPIEWFVYVFSILINAWATYLFYWTDYVKP